MMMVMGISAREAFEAAEAAGLGLVEADAIQHVAADLAHAHRLAGHLAGEKGVTPQGDTSPTDVKKIVERIRR